VVSAIIVEAYPSIPWLIFIHICNMHAVRWGMVYQLDSDLAHVGWYMNKDCYFCQKITMHE